MSNFVKGLVRRGAGLPSPVAIRPVAAPQQMQDSPTLTAEESIHAPALQNTTAAREAETPPNRIEPILQPHAAIITSRSAETRAPEISQEEQTLSLSREPAQPALQNSSDKTPAVAVPSLAPTRASTDLIPLAPTGIFTGQTKSQDVAVKLDTPPQKPNRQSEPLQSAGHGSPALNPVRQQPPEAVRPTKSAPVLPPIATREAASESRNIQVKIGKVEIRSTQPATVVQVQRRTSTSGFEDLKMARNYFDRARG